mgnify:CR=1 FL=1
MNTREQLEKLFDYIENYYRYNPDTLMPMLMAALAAKGKLNVTTTPTEGSVVLYKLELSEILNYEWVQLNRKLRSKVKEALKNGSQILCVEGFIDDELMDIYEIFHKYDTVTVEEEYHHRIGLLNDHTKNLPSESAHRKYATVRMVEALVALPVEFLHEHFFQIANDMLQRSGLQPKRPRAHVADALSALLEYDGHGKVYNPFAGCGVAAAMMKAGANMYADGNTNDKLFAVARLLNHGVSGSYENYRQRDSRLWTEGEKFDYILSTYRGYVDGQSAFDFCLSKCFDTLAEGGKYAGIASPKEIFEKQSAVFKEALKRDWVETIILLPFAEVAVLINTRKPKELKSKVCFYDFTSPFLRRRSVAFNMSRIGPELIRVADVRKKGYLRSLVVPEIKPSEGCKLVTLRDYVKKIRRQTYSLARVSEDKRVLVTINRSKPYDDSLKILAQGIKRESVSYLFTPVYHLKRDSLIFNDRGDLQPRLFRAKHGSAFFGEAYAFEFINPKAMNYKWLFEELNSYHVKCQLHPYGTDELLPGLITEEQILDLKLNKPIEEEEPILGDASLEPGYVVKSGNMEYTIQKFLSSGFFGYTYIAMQKNKTTGQQSKVVLKECYPYTLCDRDGVRIVLTDQLNAWNLEDCRRKFREEADIMKRLGNRKESHIVSASSAFFCEETDTFYYAMPCFENGSLKDLREAGFPFKESMVIDQIIKPLCKALHLAHNDKVLHLDVKPDNILIDDNGEVVLIDFGVAKQYDAEGNVVSTGTYNLGGPFAAPELENGDMVRFGRPADVYALAACIYYLFAYPQMPYPIMEYSSQDQDLRISLSEANCSKQFSDAIIAGLQFSASSRPADIQSFLNMFPGCEDIKL